MHGFVAVDDQLRTRPRAVDIVAQYGNATGPFATPPLAGNLVANPLADDLSLELCERQQDVQRQPTHRVCRVEVLSDGNERDVLLVERPHDPREVEQRSAEPVDLVDDHAVDFAGLDVGQQTKHCRSFEVASRVPAVVVTIGKRDPAFLRLAGDVAFRGIPLRIERVELLLQSFFVRLASVDGAADGFHFAFGGVTHSGFLPNRKNTKPL